MAARPAPVSGETRLAELLAAFSAVTDLARGHPPDEAMRACLLATALARRFALPERDVSDVYYTALLRFLGCTATSHDYATRFGGDDVAFRQRGDMIDSASSEGIGFLWGLTAGSGLRFEDRGTHRLKGIPDDWQLYALA